MLATLTFPKQSRKKKIKQVLNFFFTLCFIASIKNIKQNMRENIVQYCTTKPALKFCAPN